METNTITGGHLSGKHRSFHVFDRGGHTFVSFYLHWLSTSLLLLCGKDMKYLMTISNHSGLIPHGKYGHCEWAQSSWPAFRPHKLTFVLGFWAWIWFFKFKIRLFSLVLKLKMNNLSHKFESSVFCCSSPLSLDSLKLCLISHRSIFFCFSSFLICPCTEQQETLISLSLCTHPVSAGVLSRSITSTSTNRYSCTSSALLPA